LTTRPAVNGTTLVARVIPPSIVGRRARHLLERNLLVYRRIWVIVFSGFFEPVFYLFAIGVGVGAMIPEVTLADGTAVSYTAFLAPAMLAASAMNGAVYESTMNIFFKLKYAKTYDAVLATPMGPGDVAVGEITWSLIRGGLYAAAFLIVMQVMGLIESPWGILALPAALLIGLAFASVGMVATTFMKSWQDFDLVQMVTLPLFLFSGTFFPIVPGTALWWAAQISPLYHGVELIRSLTLGVLQPVLIWHIAFLTVMSLVGLVVAARRIGKLLLA
jgi:lipooligosaccharide transport system permease protein